MPYFEWQQPVGLSSSARCALLFWVSLPTTWLFTRYEHFCKSLKFYYWFWKRTSPSSTFVLRHHVEVSLIFCQDRRRLCAPVNCPKWHGLKTLHALHASTPTVCSRYSSWMFDESFHYSIFTVSQIETAVKATIQFQEVATADAFGFFRVDDGICVEKPFFWLRCALRLTFVFLIDYGFQRDCPQLLVWYGGCSYVVGNNGSRQLGGSVIFSCSSETILWTWIREGLVVPHHKKYLRCCPRCPPPFIATYANLFLVSTTASNFHFRASAGFCQPYWAVSHRHKNISQFFYVSSATSFLLVLSLAAPFSTFTEFVRLALFVVSAIRSDFPTVNPVANVAAGHPSFTVLAIFVCILHSAPTTMGADVSLTVSSSFPASAVPSFVSVPVMLSSSAPYTIFIPSTSAAPPISLTPFHIHRSFVELVDVYQLSSAMKPAALRTPLQKPVIFYLHGHLACRSPEFLELDKDFSAREDCVMELGLSMFAAVSAEKTLRSLAATLQDDIARCALILKLHALLSLAASELN